MRKEAKKLFEIFEGKEIYLVGGYVRDSVLGISNDDLDFATKLLPDEIIAILKSNHLKCWEIGKAFGTISTMIDGLKIEITTYRVNEKYEKNNRHPRVEFGKTLKEDLMRRDFTINALAMDRIGTIIDPLNIFKDLREHVIRTPLEPDKTFSDDPLRMIRAVRFVSTLGFSIDSTTLTGIFNNAHKILGLAVERIKVEMDKLLLGDYVDLALSKLVETKLINYYLPEIINLLNIEQNKDYHHKDIWKHTKSVVKNSPKDIIVRWAALLHDIAKPYTKSIDQGEVHFYNHEDFGAKLSEYILMRLKFSNKEIKDIVSLIKNHMRPNLYSPKWADKAVRKLRKDMGDSLINKLLALSRADITSQRPDRIDLAMKRLDDLEGRLNEPEIKEDFVLPVNGHEIMEALGIQSGPLVGRLKSQLSEAIESGGLPRISGEKWLYLNFVQHLYEQGRYYDM